MEYVLVLKMALDRKLTNDEIEWVKNTCPTKNSKIIENLNEESL